MKTVVKFLWVVAFAVMSSSLMAQGVLTSLQMGKTYRFDLVDGSSRTGVLDSADSEFMFITNVVSGPEKIYLSGVIKAKLFLVNESGKFANPHYSRYLFGPSAIPHKKGEVYWNNLWLEVNTVQVGITENLSVGMGSLLFSSLSGNLSLMPNFKYSIPLNEKTTLAVGNISLLLWPKNEVFFGATLPFAVATFGGSEANFSIGTGWAGTSEVSTDTSGVGVRNFQWSDYPTVYAAVSKRLSRNWIFQLEGYGIAYNQEDWQGNVTQRTNGIALFSFRYIQPNSSWDFGGVVINDSGTEMNFAVPLIGYTQKF